ncbi:MAG: FkbM family methyltransferase [Rhodobacteraceae bacterium]|nr:MAG: FkbM family methyltransferase [Paracoccaceae bacterium]
MAVWRGFLRSLFIYNNPAITHPMRRFYRSLLREGDLAFDIGAHVGTRARAMRAVGARVVALEPQAPFSGFLRLTLPRDIRFLAVAAGPSEAVAKMAVSSRHPTVSSLRHGFSEEVGVKPGFEHVRWDAVQDVTVTTLDKLIAEEGLPRYIKIDVEGFELDVLAGLSQPVELISVEYLPGLPHLSHAVIDRLLELGPYRFNPVMGETGAFLWQGWRDAAATRDWLRSLPTDATSGDLYARLPG